MNSLDFEKRVATQFSTSIQPDKNETWEELYKHLESTVFDSHLTDKEKLIKAAELGCEKAVKALGNIDVRTNDIDETALMSVVRKGNAAAAKILIKSGADINLTVCSLSVLFLAYTSKSHDTMRVCLEEGAKIDRDLIKKIIQNKDNAAVALLQDFEQTIDDVEKSPLFDILNAKDIDTEELEWAIKAGCDVNHTDEAGISPLHYAYGRRHIRAIECLEKHEAKFKISKDSDSPLHWLFFEGPPETRWKISCEEYKIWYKSMTFRICLKILPYSLRVWMYYNKIKNWLSPTPKKES